MKVTAIIVTYNGVSWLSKCLDSLLQSTIPIEILVIDNCSTDATVSLIKEKYSSKCLLIESKENLGFGKGNNIGLKIALENQSDYVFLLNQDATVEPNTIEGLVETSQKNSQYGILSPLQLEPSGMRLERLFFNFMAKDSSRRFYSDFVLHHESCAIYPIDFVQAAAWLLPIHTVRTIGGFDPIFFHYGEDDNYCQRVLYHNLKIGVVPKFKISHDSERPISPTIPLFSEKYYNQYILKLLCKYGDLALANHGASLKKERRKNINLMISKLIKFDLKGFIGMYKQLQLFDTYVPLLEKSRTVNAKIYPNHLYES
jgi:GT2 family glycosyltransferase